MPGTVNKVYQLKRSDGSPAELVNGIWRCLDSEEEARLERWLPVFNNSRKETGKYIPDSKSYPDLPYGNPIPGFEAEWKLRRKGWEWLKNFIPPRYSSGLALDLGAWNGWLSNRLTISGFEVIAADLFADAQDGLGAQQYYQEKWTSVQMDPNHLSVLGEKFDLIVFNHCLAFMSDPLQSLQQAKSLLAPGGWIILLGLGIFKDAAPHEVRIQLKRNEFKNQYGQELLFYPSKGVLSAMDMKAFMQEGFRFERYPGLFKSRIKAALSSSAPNYYIGTFVKP